MFCLHSIVKLPLALNDNATTYRQKGADVIPFNTKIPTCMFQFLHYAYVIVIFSVACFTCNRQLVCKDVRLDALTIKFINNDCFY